MGIVEIVTALATVIGMTVAATWVVSNKVNAIEIRGLRERNQHLQHRLHHLERTLKSRNELDNKTVVSQWISEVIQNRKDYLLSHLVNHIQQDPSSFRVLFDCKAKCQCQDAVCESQKI